MNKIELTPKEAKDLAQFINKHPNEYIELESSLGIGIGEYLYVQGEKGKRKDITDYESI